MRPISASRSPSRTRRSAMARYSAFSVSSSLALSSSSWVPALRAASNCCQICSNSWSAIEAGTGKSAILLSASSSAFFSRIRDMPSYSCCWRLVTISRTAARSVGAELLRQFVVSLRDDLRAELLDGDVERRGLAGQIGLAVILREGDVDRPALARARALKLFGKPGNEPLAADFDLACRCRCRLRTARRRSCPRNRP